LQYGFFIRENKVTYIGLVLKVMLMELFFSRYNEELLIKIANPVSPYFPPRTPGEGQLG